MTTITQTKLPLVPQILMAALLLATSASAATNTLEVNIKARFVELPPDSDWQQKFDWYSKAPATSSSFGVVLTGAQFKTALQEIEKRHGADLLNEGQVTTLSGRQAQFSDVDVQTIPESTSRNDANNGSASRSENAGIQKAGITLKFDPQTDPLGTTVDVIPFVSPDGITIHMAVIATVTEFTGYDNPGMPLYGDPPKLSQPHCRVRQFTNSCTIPEGATMVLRVGQGTPQNGPGALTLMSDSTQTNDLLIFVTPTVIDASGNPIHSKDYYDGPIL